ncbi:hypothetical protein GL279_07015 [Paracoccus limosus]|uniref:CopL family metal-binding regulatory protein n=1 Tax=Paracoccus limosus TaxID=913252 RepID=A0A844H779_9RHOB|nr:hypothetical protein [Paracoccus limosus]MTH34347.1 hypothetical protein [Paracoccus limosus]
MLCRLITFMTILCLWMAPGIAADHAMAAPMAMAAHDAPHHIAQDGTGCTCPEQGGCAKQAAACAWACAGIAVMQPQPAAARGTPVPRLMHTAHAGATASGRTPAPSARPPDPSVV